MTRPFNFLNGPWENSVWPTIVRDDPEGGDPHILATLKRVHNPDALYELCRLANDSVERGTSEGIAAGGLGFEKKAHSPSATRR